ncbi:MAG: hypothetical protein HW378_204 [Anaerolineales bacterium]|nr:hypothetical protein [Anaerolineales bacterium]
MTPAELLARSYSSAQMAGDLLSDAVTAMENARALGPAAETRILQTRWPAILAELRNANAAAEALERRLAGVPAPKVGD